MYWKLEVPLLRTEAGVWGGGLDTSGWNVEKCILWSDELKSRTGAKVHEVNEDRVDEDEDGANRD